MCRCGEVLHLPGNTGVRGWAFLAAFMVLVTAGNAALLSLLAWRWTLKPAAGLLVLMAAFGAYFMLAYGIAIDASMLTNVLQTDVKEAGDLLNWQLPLTVGALAVPPVAWLVRQPVRAWHRCGKRCTTRGFSSPPCWWPWVRCCWCSRTLPPPCATTPSCAT